MRLLCHDTACEGHGCRAGSDPHGTCRYCAQPLTDGLGVLLIEPDWPPIMTDLDALEICNKCDHVLEGRIAQDCREAHGVCSRCGIQVTVPL